MLIQRNVMLVKRALVCVSIISLILSSSSTLAGKPNKFHKAKKQVVEVYQEIDFTSGKTSLKEVIDVLGNPNSKTKNSDGSSILVWIKSNVKVKAASFIPYVNLLAGGATSDMQITSVTFDRDNIVQEFSTSTHQSDYNSGLINHSSN